MKIPKKLRESEAYAESREVAVGLWLDGFRPTKAENLKKGDRVTYRDTDIFRLVPVGPYKVGTVESVKNEGFGEVEVMHTGCAHGDPAICDEWDEVWRIKASKVQE
jgi:hypothetical protein